MRARSPLSIAAISAAVLVIVVALGLTFTDWNLFKGPIERGASARFGRAVTIAGLTPLAATLAFVDPGLAEDQNCAELLAQGQQPSIAQASAPGRFSLAEPSR